MTRSARGIAAAACALLLGGCWESGEEEAPPPPRPVLSVVVEPKGRSVSEFAGTIAPRIQTERGFQVLGRIQSFDVDVGDVVRRGRRLAALDPTTFALDVRAREGDVERARSQLANAGAAEQRTQRLVSLNVSSQAELDADAQAREAANAAVEQAEAALARAREQFGYATLVADADGIVIAKEADVGQTVSAGQRVLTLASLESREAVVDVPDAFAGSLGPDTVFRVLLQADPTVAASGKVREVAPQADESTRTRRVRITLADPPEALRIGATIRAVLEDGAGGQGLIEIPRSAVFEANGTTKVWIVDPQAKAVRSVAVVVLPGESAMAQVERGLPVGAHVVVAGARSLEEGQTIRFEEGAAP